jgi:transposase-like protein
MIKLSQLNALFATEEACKEFLFKHRWPDGVRCPRCGNEKVYTLKQPWKWQCHSKTCGKKGYRFSLISGTVFENTKYPLKAWFTVAFLMLHSKKGMSALQIKRMIFHDKASYETVWYMCTRIRAAMNNDDFKELMGIVEVDETFIGGKDKNRHWDKKSHVTGGIGSGKVGVIGAISRKGNIVCQVIENTDAKTLNRFVRKAVSEKVDLVAADEHRGYDYLGALGYKHEAVSHSAGEYVRGKVHTNHVESFWSLLKRGLMGSYHQVSKKYLPLYLAEFSFRHNHRKDEDMFGKLIAGC